MAKTTGRRTLDGAELIAAERKRQVSQGWTYDHDDRHCCGELAVAAAELAVDGTDARISLGGHDHDHCGSLAKYGYKGENPDTVRALTIAGALIAAEIDRLQRAGSPTSEPDDD